MGHNLRQQRRGKGSPVYEAMHRGIAVSFVPISEQQGGVLRGQVVDLIKDSGRNSIIALMRFEDGSTNFVVAPEGLSVGQEVRFGKNAPIAIGNVLPLGQIPEGCPIFSIEGRPGDGGKFVRGTGNYALLVSKDNNRVFVKMPSGETKEFSLERRAMVGCVAGGGRTEKPRLKAGAAYHFMRAKERKYPRLRGVAMNAADHPFGGSQHHAGKSKSTSRNAPPGRKVGAIASKRTGRKKKN